jgi:hypothetical protein
MQSCILFDLELEPFKYFGMKLTSVYIEGVDWNNLMIRKANFGREFVKPQPGITIEYLRKNLQISRITISAENYDDGYRLFKKYTGNLPRGISLLMSRKEVLQKLGKPSSSSIGTSNLCRDIGDPPPEYYYSDFYDFGDGSFELHYSYDDFKYLYLMLIQVNSLKLDRGEELNINYSNKICEFKDRGIISLVMKIINRI